MSQLRLERKTDGTLVAWIFSSADRNALRRCSETLVAELGAQPTERFDGMDQIFLDFVLAGSSIVLQWAKDKGIAVGAGATAPASDFLIERVAAHLAERVSV